MLISIPFVVRNVGEISTSYCGLNTLGAGTSTVIYGSGATQLVGIIFQLHEESCDSIDTCGFVDHNYIVEGHGHPFPALGAS